jgi:feruloyl esterase
MNVLRLRQIERATLLSALLALTTLVASHPICARDNSVLPQARSCEMLKARVLLPEARIEESLIVAGPAFSPAAVTTPLTGLPSFCRVVGVIHPAIRFEVWLPLKDWNGKFNAVGGGGFAGAISYGPMAEALKRGYATASTDTGHADTDTTWLNDEGRLVDYGYRAIHEMTLKSKAILGQFYSRPAQRAYFTGCSTGGRQGVMEAERYPEDYDGVLAGAPVNSLVQDMLAQLWAAQAALKDAESRLPLQKLTLLNKAVLARCDASDGVVDAVLENPRACDFEPLQLQCSAGQDPTTCLTPAQVETARRIYAGPSNPRTGVRISAGYERGSEDTWAQLIGGPRPFIIADTVAQVLNPGYDFRTSDFEADADRFFSRLGGIWNATNPDLRRAARRGTKIILYHGWSDFGVPPGNTVSYYQKVKYVVDADHRGADDFIRLFMLPGVGHCGGGPGADQFDGLTALERWVERGEAPSRIVASHLNGGVVDKTRPLCPYPEEARYDGHGDTKLAASFSCGRR